MTTPDAPLDDWTPLEPVQRDAQISALRQRFEQIPCGRERRLLDLGCGDGSLIETLGPVISAATGVDCDARARKAARRRLRQTPAVRLIDADFIDATHAGRWAGVFDLAACLGHTWMLVVDDDVAASIFSTVRDCLAPGGSLVIDNFPGELWPLVESGDWQTGLSEDGSCQMILDAQRGLVALRYGDEVDEQCRRFRPDDQVMRLWTMEQLAALAERAGFRPPRLDAAHYLIWFDVG